MTEEARRNAPTDALLQALERALVTALGTARWPSGSLLVDLDPQVIRTHLAPTVRDEAARQLDRPDIEAHQ